MTVRQGMAQSGISATVKRFPEIGRVSGSTVKTAAGIDDSAMTADDPLLARSPTRSTWR